MYKIPYGRQNITLEDIAAVNEVLQEDFITQGPRIPAFEQAFAEYIGCKYAVAVTSGTAALHLAALALEVNHNSKVITSPITFVASANCIRYCGGSVEFADIDPETVTLDIKAVERMLRTAPKGTYEGIIPVDMAGYAVNLEAFRELADEFGLWLLEDACHAPGGYFKDSKGQKQNCGNGQFADLAIFSFHPVKHIACGEGGMITTNDSNLYEKLCVLRTHGITKDPKVMSKNDGGWYYEMNNLGYNYRLTDFQAALGISQLKRAPQNLKRRHVIAKRYDSALANIDSIQLLPPPADGEHAYHLYIILTDQRKALYDYLRARGIFVQIHYIPVHTQPYYRALAEQPVHCPAAEAYYERCLSLPMYPTLSDEEQEYVIDTIRQFFV